MEAARRAVGAPDPRVLDAAVRARAPVPLAEGVYVLRVLPESRSRRHHPG